MIEIAGGIALFILGLFVLQWVFFALAMFFDWLTDTAVKSRLNIIGTPRRKQ